MTIIVLLKQLESPTQDGEAADITLCELDESVIALEQMYDGFYAVCTNLEDDATEISKIKHKRWEIEECFRIMKTDFTDALHDVFCFHTDYQIVSTKQMKKIFKDTKK